jgi:glycosyltransferase involved in cell wall biosynthesis
MNSTTQRPMVSVVMPVRNEATFIERGIRAVLEQDYPADRIEIIVADGMSTDGTRELLNELAGVHACIHVVDNPRGIAPTALNLAIAKASGEIIVRVDGHCEIARDYVSRCVEHLEAGEAECVGGPLETIGESYWARVIASAMSSNFGVGGAAFRTVKDRSLYVDTVAFPAMKRETIERAGPFDEVLMRNQDDEYSYRLRGMGARILLASDVRSRYYSRASIAKLARQYFQYGYYKVRVMQKHPKGMSTRQFVPAAFVSALAVSGVAAITIPHGWIAAAAVAGSYCAAALLAAVRTAAQDGWTLLPALPIAFGTLHFSYGLGFLSGLVRFRSEFSAGLGNRAIAKRSSSSR